MITEKHHPAAACSPAMQKDSHSHAQREEGHHQRQWQQLMKHERSNDVTYFVSPSRPGMSARMYDMIAIAATSSDSILGSTLSSVSAGVWW